MPVGCARRGFYDYDEAGKRGSIWSGLSDLFPIAAEQVPFQDIKDRMLFAEALETAKCFEEGVIESAAAANIGSIMGIGFPPDDRRRRAVHDRLRATRRPAPSSASTAFVKRADELAEKYGDRFAPDAVPPGAWLPRARASRPDRDSSQRKAP